MDVLFLNTPAEQASTPASGVSLASEGRKRLILGVVAILLFLVAIACLWGLIAEVVSLPKAPDSQIYTYVIAVVVSFLLLAAILPIESRLGERLRLGAEYQDRVDQLQSRLSYREELLRLIADHQSGSITIFDRHNRYWFVNEKAAAEIGKGVAAIIGLPPIKVLPNEQAMKLEVRLAEARASDKPVVTVDSVVDERGMTRFLQRHYEAVTNLADVSGCVMLREDDLTNLIVEKEKREQMLRQVIDTLVAVVDRRDPYASGHSSRVGQLARAIAAEMGLDETMGETAEIAGALMNFGKVLVSRRILTKTSALTSEELQRVRDSILTSADILAIINFSGPVVETLRQVLEHYDGTGEPEGLVGDKILMTARIVAVANAFVAFVSPRAHRDGLSFRDALNVMAKDSATIYDERVLIALTHYIENRPNKLDWLMVTKQASA